MSSFRENSVLNPLVSGLFAVWLLMLPACSHCGRSAKSEPASSHSVPAKQAVQNASFAQNDRETVSSQSDTKKESAVVKMPVVKPRDPLVDVIYPEACVNAQQFSYFLTKLGANRLNQLGTAIGIEDMAFNAEPHLAVRKQIIWHSSHWGTYGFKSNDVDYHELVKWTAAKMEVPEQEITSLPTFALERKILERVFIKTWDSMSEAEREQFLRQLDKNHTLNNTGGTALLSGAAALAALNGTVLLTGFAFYTTMSSLICASASAVGVGLGFGAYTGASATVGALCGPVGWVALGVCAIGGAAMIGTADYQKTAADICVIHLMKVEAYENSGIDITPYLK